MKVRFPVEFNREKYDLNYKSDIYKIKTMALTSRKNPLKVFIRFYVWSLPD